MKAHDSKDSIRKHLRLLTSSDSKEVSRGVGFFIMRRAKESTQRLLEIAQSDGSEPLRCSALFALANQSDATCISAILNIACGRNEPVVLREFAIRSVGSLVLSTISARLSRITREGDWRLRWAATDALTSLYSDANRKCLENLITDDSIPFEVRCAMLDRYKAILTGLCNSVIRRIDSQAEQLSSRDREGEKSL